MGLRGELFSTKVVQQNRTYFFNVKENRMGDLYLNIVESKNKETGGFDRQSVIFFADDLQEFLKGFEEALKVLEKEMRERRRAGRNVIRHTEGEGDREGRRDREERRGREGGGGRDREERPVRESGGRRDGEGRPAREGGRRHDGDGRRGKSDFSEKPRKDRKKVVVRKNRGTRD
jgi:hypothetical protein